VEHRTLQLLKIGGWVRERHHRGPAAPGLEPSR
jgi:hypothetical protein